MPPCNKNSNKDNKKQPLMEGQSDAERRELRHSQRLLHRTMSQQTEVLEDAARGADEFARIRAENNALFERVRYTREAVLDGENLNLLSTRAARQVDKLLERAQYDAARFTKKLREKCCNGQQFDWKSLGQETGACYNAVPSRVSFLNGPLQADYAPKERAKPVRRQKHPEDDEEEEDEEEPEDVKTREAADANQLSAVERSMKVIYKVLRKRSRENFQTRRAAVEALPSEEERRAAIKRLKREHGGVDTVPAVPFLLHPTSFTQSVENMFHFSFLVKQGRAQIKVVGGQPVVSEAPKAEMPPPSRQAIVALNMKGWRDMLEAYGVKKGDIPHRGGGGRKKGGSRAREVTPTP